MRIDKGKLYEYEVGDYVQLDVGLRAMVSEIIIKANNSVVYHVWWLHDGDVKYLEISAVELAKLRGFKYDS